MKSLLNKSNIAKNHATILLMSACLLGAATGCIQKKVQPQNSSIKTTDIKHSSVKWQSIGNCWIYAVVGWTESLMLLNGNEVNISESYITYNHLLEEILSNPNTKSVNAGGNWYIAGDLITKYGVMLEGDFIPEEANKTCSLVQKKALDTVNKLLASGEFAKNPTETGIRKLLDMAFGVNSSALKSKVIPADKIMLADDAGQPTTHSLAEEIQSWRSILWPVNLGFTTQTKPLNEKLGVGTYEINPTTEGVLKRVKKALNNHKPVLLSWFVDFNAMDNNGTFSMQNILAKGALGRQGGHMTVIEDYVAHGVNPETQESFKTTEGEVPEELKKLAEEYGEIDYFVLKNSWGGAERSDRSSYTHDGQKGFTRLNADYLFGYVTNVEENFPKVIIQGFVLPMGY